MRSVPTPTPQLTRTTRTEARGGVQESAEIARDGSDIAAVQGCEFGSGRLALRTPRVQRTSKSSRPRAGGRRQRQRVEPPDQIEGRFLAEGMRHGRAIALPAPSHAAQPGLARCEFAVHGEVPSRDPLCDRHGRIPSVSQWIRCRRPGAQTGVLSMTASRELYLSASRFVPALIARYTRHNTDAAG